MTNGSNSRFLRLPCLVFVDVGLAHKKRAEFWGLYLIAFFSHCAVFVTMFSYGRWPISLLAVVGSLEIMAIATLIALAMGKKF